jgi:uncharacterized protein YqgC (DUF456 family)
MYIKYTLFRFLTIAAFIFITAACGNAAAGSNGTSTEAIPPKESISTNTTAQHLTNSIRQTALQDNDKEPDKQHWRKSFTDTAKQGGKVAAKLFLFVIVAFVCLVSLVLSMLSFSGAWLILLASALTLLLVKTPGWATQIVFLLVAITGEVIEAVSTFHGVKKRGGSKWAGAAGLAGSIAGAMAGAAVIPVVGALIGLLAGTFLGVFLVEWNRLKHHGDATHIAWGAFYSRLFVLFIKITSTIIMSIWLLWCLARIVF